MRYLQRISDIGRITQANATLGVNLSVNYTYNGSFNIY